MKFRVLFLLLLLPVFLGLAKPVFAQTPEQACLLQGSMKWCADTATCISRNATCPSGCDSIGQSGLDLAQCYKLNGQQNVGTFFSSPASLVNLLVRVIFVVSGIILFFMIIYSGFLFISGGTKGQEQAKNVMTSAILGMVIIFSAYWIMQVLRLLTGADIGFTAF